MDLRQILVIDGIDILPDGFRIRCHDLHGQLPETVMKNGADTFQDKDLLGNEVCKLIAMVKLRDERTGNKSETIQYLPDCLEWFDYAKNLHASTA